MVHLTREQIIQAPDLKTVEVEVPEWGGSVLMREMNGEERIQFEDAYKRLMADSERSDSDKAIQTMALLVSTMIVDDAGEHVFAPDDAALLAKKSSGVLVRLTAAAKKLSSISEADLDELRKN